MKKTIQLFIIVFIFSFTYQSSLRAQDDCCGMGSIFSSLLQSGIFGGYGVQMYDAKGLNEVLPEGDFKDYGTSWGWRVGANIIQLQQKDLMMGLKFYYQQTTEKQSITDQEIKMDLKQLNLGISFSYIVNNNIDIRVFDALMSWTSAELTNDVEGFDKDVYKSPESNIGFTFDTGVVYYPFPPYFSIEVLGDYSFFSIDEVKLEEGESSLTKIENIVDGGGFFAMAVLTVGIPFN